MNVLSTIKRAFGQVIGDGNRGSWWPTVREPYTGAWQKNEELRTESVVQNPTVYACVTLIANDIGTLRNKLVVEDGNGLTSETTSPAFSPVLMRPNRYQNHIQFKQWWQTSKFLWGNAYALKQRDGRGVVVGLYLLDPGRMTVLVAPDGDIFYQYGQDNLNGLEGNDQVFPASEIIHDRMNCLFHPLVGTSPIFAAAYTAGIGLKIIKNSAYFFGNNSAPSGVLVIPGDVSIEQAKAYKEHWKGAYGEAANGSIAVLPGGVKFESIRMSAVDAQLIEILRWTDEKIASVFHVPGYKVGVGQIPAINNTETLAKEYYNSCLKTPIEEYEACMTEGLGLEKMTDGKRMSVELDLTGLFRMDLKNQIETLGTATDKGLMTINEGRRQLNLKPVEGGDSIWMQQQNYSLEALAERDREQPIPADNTPALQAPEPAPEDPELTPEEQTRLLMDALRKGIGLDA